MPEYIDEAYVVALADEYGLTFNDNGPDADADIVRARVFLDAMNWQGRKTGGRDQREQWPRVGVYDRDGYPVDSTTVPPEIKDANAILAIVEQDNSVLEPVVTTSELVESVKAGDVTIKFRTPNGWRDARPIVTRMMDILAPLAGKRNPFKLRRG